MGLTYRQEGDYLIPNLTLPEQPEGVVGKYGLMRKAYLMEHQKALFSRLSVKGALKQHLLDIDKAAWEMRETLVKQMLKENPGPDKMENQMGWVQHQNMIIHQAEEVILQDLIYG